MTTQEIPHRELLDRLAARGLAASAQRVALLGLIMNTDQGHFSADDLYQRLRAQFPTLSRATVYNNLGALADARLIEKLDTSDGSRFGAEVEPHINLVCRSCDSITDVLVGDPALNGVVDRALEATAFEAHSISLSIRGLCERCRA